MEQSQDALLQNSMNLEFDVDTNEIQCRIPLACTHCGKGNLSTDSAAQISPTNLGFKIHCDSCNKISIIDISFVGLDLNIKLLKTERLIQT